MSQHNDTLNVESSPSASESVDFPTWGSHSGPIPKLNPSEPGVKPAPKVCEFCGFYITEYYQRCAALDDGVCRA